MGAETLHFYKLPGEADAVGSDHILGSEAKPRYSDGLAQGHSPLPQGRLAQRAFQKY